MTKQEWLECVHITKMLNQITNDRKLRLFACVITRQIWHLLEETSKNAVIVAERYADGEATLEELESAKIVTYAWVAINDAYYAAWYATYFTARNITDQNQCNLLREIVNPYHIPTIYPNLAIEIAQNIYKTQDFTGTPILADALEENNITDLELLEHLRLKDHVRGCWAIDAIRIA